MLHDGHILLVGKVFVGPVDRKNEVNEYRKSQKNMIRLKIYGVLQNNMVSKLNPQITISNLSQSSTTSIFQCDRSRYVLQCTQMSIKRTPAPIVH